MGRLMAEPFINKLYYEPYRGKSYTDELGHHWWFNGMWYEPTWCLVDDMDNYKIETTDNTDD